MSTNYHNDYNLTKVLLHLPMPNCASPVLLRLRSSR